MHRITLIMLLDIWVKHRFKKSKPHVHTAGVYLDTYRTLVGDGSGEALLPPGV